VSALRNRLGGLQRDRLDVLEQLARADERDDWPTVKQLARLRLELEVALEELPDQLAKAEGQLAKAILNLHAERNGEET